MIFKALKQNSEVIQFIKNPSEKMMKFVIRKNWKLTEFMKNPSEEMKEFAEIHKNLEGG
jgi:hypothetical protein